MNAADRRRLTPLLGIVAVLLALLLIALWAGLGRGARWHDKAAAPKLPSAGNAPTAPLVPPLARYAEVWQHPLFSPTRTPEAVATGGGETSSDLQLTGVIMLPGLHMAILHDKASGRDYRVVEGQASQGGPVLVELHPRNAVVEASGSRLQLQLVPGPSPEAGNAPPAEGQGAPMQGPGSGSGMVTRPEAQNPESMQGAGPGSDSAEARARALKARIEAQRRRAQHPGGGP